MGSTSRFRCAISRALTAFVVTLVTCSVIVTEPAIAIAQEKPGFVRISVLGEAPVAEAPVQALPVAKSPVPKTSVIEAPVPEAPSQACAPGDRRPLSNQIPPNYDLNLDNMLDDGTGSGAGSPALILGGDGDGGANSRDRRLAGGDSGGAPNLIGDFFGTGDDIIGVRTRVRLTPLPSVNIFATPADLANDLFNGTPLTDGGLGGIEFDIEVLDPVADVFIGGTIERTEYSPPVTLLNLQSNATPSEILMMTAAAGSVSAVEPLPISEVNERIRNGIAQLEPELADRINNFSEFVRVAYNETDSEIMVFGTGPSVSAFAIPRYVYDLFISVPAPSPGDFVGRVVFSDNNSPIPRDRVYFDYNYFHNARFGPADVPVNRFMPGFEKTFAEGNMSIEFRLPMSVTLSSTQTSAGNDVLDYEVGDLGIAVKALLYETDSTYWTAGLGITVPTADDFRLNLSDGTPLMAIENESVRLAPYVAALWEPNDRTFFQAFSSMEFDVSGNPVLINDFGSPVIDPGKLVKRGQLNGGTLYKFDGSAGFWAARNREDKRITDVALVAEAHLTADIGSTDLVQYKQLSVGNSKTPTILNTVIGAHLHFGPSTVLTAGVGVPVTKDRFFDSELRVFLNKYF